MLLAPKQQDICFFLADVHFAGTWRQLVVFHSSLLLDRLEPRKVKFFEKEVRQEFIEEELSVESLLESTNKKS